MLVQEKKQSIDENRKRNFGRKKGSEENLEIVVNVLLLFFHIFLVSL